MEVDADVHHAGTYDGDAGRRCRGEALEAQGRGGVGRADGERRAHGHDLDPALRNGQAGGEHAADDYEPPCGAKAEAAGWDGQPRLVDPVDLDVLALVEADDVDIDRGTREHGQCQVADAITDSHAGQFGGSDRIDPEDAYCRAYQRVRPGEAPKRDGSGKP